MLTEELIELPSEEIFLYGIRNTKTFSIFGSVRILKSDDVEIEHCIRWSRSTPLADLTGNNIIDCIFNVSAIARYYGKFDYKRRWMNDRRTANEVHTPILVDFCKTINTKKRDLYKLPHEDVSRALTQYLLSIGHLLLVQV